MSRFKAVKVLAILAFLMTFGLVHTAAAATPTATSDRVSILDTKMALRDLWVEHTFWIRSYVLATHAGDKAQQRTAEAEVLENAKALSQSIAPFYGQAASNSLHGLLAGHWSAVRAYNTAVLAKSKTGQDKAIADATANAHAIAKFLSGANPNLPEDAVFALLAGHFGHHVSQITQISSNDFQAEAATWHVMRHHMFMISDAIADALVKQFPKRFEERK
jgi:hypothetical protein